MRSPGGLADPSAVNATPSKMLATASPPLVQNVDVEMPGVAWDLLPMDKYRAQNWHCFGNLERQPYAAIYTTLGCPYHCTFCCIQAPFKSGEKELGLKIVSSDPAPDAKTRTAGRDEFEEARRLGTDLKALRNTIFDCFQGAATGAAFVAALDGAGLMLAAGDRCFVAVDPAGGHHALNKKLTGLTLAAIRPTSPASPSRTPVSN